MGKNWREERPLRLAQGLCVNCGIRPLVPPFQKCEVCRERDRKYYHKRKAKAPELCYSCRAPRDNPKSQYCTGCRDRKDELRWARVAAGKCSACAHREPRPGHKLCGTCLDYGKNRYLALKDAAFRAYGGYVCRWCGCTDRVVLNIDHVHNDGNRQRAELGTACILTWLKQNEYPPGYQVLCRNCNWAKSQGRTEPALPLAEADHTPSPYWTPYELRPAEGAR